MPIRISGLNSGLDTDSIVQELVSAYRTKQESYEKKQTQLSWKQDSWKEMNTKIYGFYSKSLSDMRMVSNYTNKKTTTVSDSTKATIVAGTSVINGTQTLKINQLATAGYLTGTKIASQEGEALAASSTLSQLGIGSGTLKLEVGGEEKSIDVTADMTISQFTSALKEAGVNASFDTAQQRFFISSTATGEANDFSFKTEDEAGVNILSGLGLATEAQYKAANPAADISGMDFATKTVASNAQIELNGALFENDSNNFNINGMTITATGVSDMMTITTATDVDGIYDMIKNFVKEYNTLMSAMETAYNATSAKGYEPLTDSEKEEMSDDEIEKWENRIKDALLRRDETLRTVMSGMSTAMSGAYTVDGKSYSLSSFGVNTSSYFLRVDNESYSYHIDGDPDDSATQGNTDRLKKAIAEDPEAIAGFFSELAKGVYASLDEKMGTTELSSIYKVYNDKQMQNEYDDYTDTIKKWEEKLADMEESYYDKFAAMETALSKLQSQTNSLTSLLGG